MTLPQGLDHDGLPENSAACGSTQELEASLRTCIEHLEKRGLSIAAAHVQLGLDMLAPTPDAE